MRCEDMTCRCRSASLPACSTSAKACCRGSARRSSSSASSALPRRSSRPASGRMPLAPDRELRASCGTPSTRPRRSNRSPIFPAICCRSCRFFVILGDVLRLRAVVARRCSWGHRGDCRAARCHSCAVDVVADQLSRCRSALDRFVDRGGEWRARGVRSLCRLPGNARTPGVRLTSDQGPCGHRSHVESRSRSLRLLRAAQRLCRRILPPSLLAAAS